MLSLEPRGAPQPALALQERPSSHKLGIAGHELVPGTKHLPSAKDGAVPQHLPLIPPSQRLVASGDSSSDTMGSPHPALQNCPPQGLWDMAAQDYRKTRHCCVHPCCCISLSSAFKMDPVLMDWAGREARTQICPAQPRAACFWPQEPPRLDWHNFGGGNRS